MFKEQIDLKDPRVLFVLSQPPAEEFLVNLFSKQLKNLSIKQIQPKILDKLELKNIKPFIWSRKVFLADRFVLNYQSCENNLELNFCKFLDKADDVKKFIKIPERKINIYTEYFSSSSAIRRYYPDFILETIKGDFFFIETKGLVDINIPRKDERAKKWCEDLTILTKKK